MEIGENSLQRRYESMETSQLVELYQRGGLTETANKVLSQVLRNRGITDVTATVNGLDESEEKEELIQNMMVNPTHSLSVPIPRNWKPSLWWAVHIWAGYCLKIYVEASGLLTRLLGPQDPTLGQSLSHARLMASATVIIAIGSLLLGFLLSKKLFDLIDGWSVREIIRLTIKLFLPVVYFLLLVALYTVSMGFFHQ